MKPLVDRNEERRLTVIFWLLVLAFALVYGSALFHSFADWLHQLAGQSPVDVLLKALMESPAARGLDL